MCQFSKMEINEITPPYGPIYCLYTTCCSHGLQTRRMCSPLEASVINSTGFDTWASAPSPLMFGMLEVQ